jgi:hypothetical protein
MLNATLRPGAEVGDSTSLWQISAANVYLYAYFVTTC